MPAPQAEGAFIMKRGFYLISNDYFLVKLIWSTAGGSMGVTRNKEGFCELKGVYVNFSQESTGADKVKICGWAPCFVATRCTHQGNIDKVNLLLLGAWFLSLGLRPPGPLFFRLQVLFCPRLSPMTHPILLQNSCIPVLLSHCYGLTVDEELSSKGYNRGSPMI